MHGYGSAEALGCLSVDGVGRVRLCPACSWELAVLWQGLLLSGKTLGQGPVPARVWAVGGTGHPTQA